jgi:hypothetical protein
VSLLLHGNGTNGSTTITDNSPSPRSVTAFGNAQISTAVADPFGNSTSGVLAFDGSGDYVTSPNNTALNLAGSNFTIEGWFYALSFSGSPALLNKDWLPGSTYPQYGVFLGSDGKLVGLIGNGASFYEQSVNSNMAAPLNTWVHFAFVSSGTQMYLFQDGSLVASGTRTGSIGTGSAALCIGSVGVGAGRFFNGYIDELRITKVARYTATFPPPTGPYPNA